jgi:hypothetical protein
MLARRDKLIARDDENIRPEKEEVKAAQRY